VNWRKTVDRSQECHSRERKRSTKKLNSRERKGKWVGRGGPLRRIPSPQKRKKVKKEAVTGKEPTKKKKPKKKKRRGVRNTPRNWEWGGGRMSKKSDILAGTLGAGKGSEGN